MQFRLPAGIVAGNFRQTKFYQLPPVTCVLNTYVVLDLQVLREMTRKVLQQKETIDLLTSSRSFSVLCKW